MALYESIKWKVVYALFVILFAANAYGQFGGGNGTADDPYLVQTAEHLDNIRDYPNNHFRQIADIDIRDLPGSNGENWKPIPSFGGVYDGSGYNIANLYIDRPEEHHQGLFSYFSFDGAIIKNVNLIGVNITGGEYVGGLIGNARNAVIENVFVSGVIKGSDRVGGIAGSLSSSEITDSYSDADVSGGDSYRSSAGGIAGSIMSATIRRSLNRGTVSSFSYTGGLVGNDNGDSKIENCYSTGSIRGTSYIGGLMGELNNSTTVSNCYSSGAVLGVRDTGGLIGITRGEDNVINSFWNSYTSGQESSAAGLPLDITGMTDMETFLGGEWDFDEIWDIEEGRTFPYLRWEGEARGHTRIQPLNLKTYPSDGEVSLEWVGYPDAGGYNIYRNREKIANVTGTEYRNTGLTNFEEYIYHVTAVYPEGETSKSNYALATPNPGFSSGEGTAENPYAVAQPEELDYVRFYKNAHFLQTAEIDLADLPQNEAGNWEPIGCNRYPFEGNYNGNGYSISNLIITREDAYFQGFFAFVRYAYLANVNLINVDITGDTNVGSLAGQAEYSFIDNCSSEGTVTAITNSAGGLVGESYYATTISNSHTSGKVFLGRVSDRLNTPENVDYEILADRETREGQGHCAGGLVGYNNYEAKILNCFSTAEVNGIYRVGGLVGENAHGGVLANSYSTGNVDGSWSVGGLVGINTSHSEYFGYAGGGIYSCFSIGKVTGGTYYSGLVGQGDPSFVYNSYWNTESSNCETSAGGEPRNTAQMTYPYDAETYIGWDFVEVWAADVDNEFNNGYPYLREDASVSIEEENGAATVTNVEMKIYPNPFNPDAVIAFDLPQPSNVRLTIYNIQGQLVKIMTNSQYQAGTHTVSWNGKDDGGNPQPSGVYFTKIETADYQQVKKIMLLK